MPASVVNRDASRKAILQIDTGASHSCISPRIASDLGLAPLPVQTRLIGESKTNDVPVYHCVVRPEPFGEIELNLAAPERLHYAPIVLFGRDVLASCVLNVDFRAGVWELHWPDSES